MSLGRLVVRLGVLAPRADVTKPQAGDLSATQAQPQQQMMIA
jgi:hypothetical protein